MGREQVVSPPDGRRRRHTGEAEKIKEYMLLKKKEKDERRLAAKRQEAEKQKKMLENLSRLEREAAEARTKPVLKKVVKERSAYSLQRSDSSGLSPRGAGAEKITELEHENETVKSELAELRGEMETLKRKRMAGMSDTLESRLTKVKEFKAKIEKQRKLQAAAAGRVPITKAKPSTEKDPIVFESDRDYYVPGHVIRNSGAGGLGRAASSERKGKNGGKKSPSAGKRKSSAVELDYTRKRIQHLKSATEDLTRRLSTVATYAAQKRPDAALNEQWIDPPPADQVVASTITVSSRHEMADMGADIGVSDLKSLAHTKAKQEKQLHDECASVIQKVFRGYRVRAEQAYARGALRREAKERRERERLNLRLRFGYLTKDTQQIEREDTTGLVYPSFADELARRKAKKERENRLVDDIAADLAGVQESMRQEEAIADASGPPSFDLPPGPPKPVDISDFSSIIQADEYNIASLLSQTTFTKSQLRASTEGRDHHESDTKSAPRAHSGNAGDVPEEIDDFAEREEVEEGGEEEEEEVIADDFEEDEGIHDDFENQSGASHSTPEKIGGEQSPHMASSPLDTPVRAGGTALQSSFISEEYADDYHDETFEDEDLDHSTGVVKQQSSFRSHPSPAPANLHIRPEFHTSAASPGKSPVRRQSDFEVPFTPTKRASTSVHSTMPAGGPPKRVTKARLSPNSLENKLRAELKFLDVLQDSEMQLAALEQAAMVAETQQEAVTLAGLLQDTQRQMEVHAQSMGRQFHGPPPGIPVPTAAPSPAMTTAADAAKAAAANAAAPKADAASGTSKEHRASVSSVAGAVEDGPARKSSMPTGPAAMQRHEHDHGFGTTASQETPLENVSMESTSLKAKAAENAKQMQSTETLDYDEDFEEDFEDDFEDEEEGNESTKDSAPQTRVAAPEIGVKGGVSGGQSVASGDGAQSHSAHIISDDDSIEEDVLDVESELEEESYDDRGRPIKRVSLKPGGDSVPAESLDETEQEKSASMSTKIFSKPFSMSKSKDKAKEEFSKKPEKTEDSFMDSYEDSFLSDTPAPIQSVSPAPTKPIRPTAIALSARRASKDRDVSDGKPEDVHASTSSLRPPTAPPVPLTSTKPSIAPVPAKDDASLTIRTSQVESLGITAPEVTAYLEREDERLTALAAVIQHQRGVAEKQHLTLLADIDQGPGTTDERKRKRTVAELKHNARIVEFERRLANARSECTRNKIAILQDDKGKQDSILPPMAPMMAWPDEMQPGLVTPMQVPVVMPPAMYPQGLAQTAPAPVVHSAPVDEGVQTGADLRIRAAGSQTTRSLDIENVDKDQVDTSMQATLEDRWKDDDFIPTYQELEDRELRERRKTIEEQRLYALEVMKRKQDEVNKSTRKWALEQEESAVRTILESAINMDVSKATEIAKERHREALQEYAPVPASSEEHAASLAATAVTMNLPQGWGEVQEDAKAKKDQDKKIQQRKWHLEQLQLQQQLEAQIAEQAAVIEKLRQENLARAPHVARAAVPSLSLQNLSADASFEEPAKPVKKSLAVATKAKPSTQSVVAKTATATKPVVATTSKSHGQPQTKALSKSPRKSPRTKMDSARSLRSSVDSIGESINESIDEESIIESDIHSEADYSDDFTDVDEDEMQTPGRKAANTSAVTEVYEDDFENSVSEAISAEIISEIASDIDVDSFGGSVSRGSTPAVTPRKRSATSTGTKTSTGSASMVSKPKRTTTPRNEVKKGRGKEKHQQVRPEISAELEELEASMEAETRRISPSPALVSHSRKSTPHDSPRKTALSIQSTPLDDSVDALLSPESLERKLRIQKLKEQLVRTQADAVKAAQARKKAEAKAKMEYEEKKLMKELHKAQKLLNAEKEKEVPHYELSDSESISSAKMNEIRKTLDAIPSTKPKSSTQGKIKSGEGIKKTVKMDNRRHMAQTSAPEESISSVEDYVDDFDEVSESLGDSAAATTPKTTKQRHNQSMDSVIESVIESVVSGDLFERESIVDEDLPSGQMDDSAYFEDDQAPQVPNPDQKTAKDQPKAALPVSERKDSSPAPVDDDDDMPIIEDSFEGDGDTSLGVAVKEKAPEPQRKGSSPVEVDDFEVDDDMPIIEDSFDGDGDDSIAYEATIAKPSSPAGKPAQEPSAKAEAQPERKDSSPVEVDDFVDDDDMPIIEDSFEGDGDESLVADDRISAKESESKKETPSAPVETKGKSSSPVSVDPFADDDMPIIEDSFDGDGDDSFSVPTKSKLQEETKPKPASPASVDPFADDDMPIIEDSFDGDGDDDHRSELIAAEEAEAKKKAAEAALAEMEEVQLPSARMVLRKPKDDDSDKSVESPRDTKPTTKDDESGSNDFDDESFDDDFESTDSPSKLEAAKSQRGPATADKKAVPESPKTAAIDEDIAEESFAEEIEEDDSAGHSSPRVEFAEGTIGGPGSPRKDVVVSKASHDVSRRSQSSGSLGEDFSFDDDFEEDESNVSKASSHKSAGARSTGSGGAKSPGKAQTPVKAEKSGLSASVVESVEESLVEEIEEGSFDEDFEESGDVVVQATPADAVAAADEKPSDAAAEKKPDSPVDVEAGAKGEEEFDDDFEEDAAETSMRSKASSHKSAGARSTGSGGAKSPGKAQTPVKAEKSGLSASVVESVEESLVEEIEEGSFDEDFEESGDVVVQATPADAVAAADEKPSDAAAEKKPDSPVDVEAGAKGEEEFDDDFEEDAAETSMRSKASSHKSAGARSTGSGGAKSPGKAQTPVKAEKSGLSASVVESVEESLVEEIEEGSFDEDFEESGDVVVQATPADAVAAADEKPSDAAAEKKPDSPVDVEAGAKGEEEFDDDFEEDAAETSMRSKASSHKSAGARSTGSIEMKPEEESTDDFTEKHAVSVAELIGEASVFEDEDQDDFLSPDKTPVSHTSRSRKLRSRSPLLKFEASASSISDLEGSMEASLEMSHASQPIPSPAPSTVSRRSRSPLTRFERSGDKLEQSGESIGVLYSATSPTPPGAKDAEVQDQTSRKSSDEKIETEEGSVLVDESVEEDLIGGAVQATLIPMMDMSDSFADGRLSEMPDMDSEDMRAVATAESTGQDAPSPVVEQEGEEEKEEDLEVAEPSQDKEAAEEPAEDPSKEEIDVDLLVEEYSSALLGDTMDSLVQIFRRRRNRAALFAAADHDDDDLSMQSPGLFLEQSQPLLVCEPTPLDSQGTHERSHGPTICVEEQYITGYVSSVLNLARQATGSASFDAVPDTVYLMAERSGNSAVVPDSENNENQQIYNKAVFDLINEVLESSDLPVGSDIEAHVAERVSAMVARQRGQQAAGTDEFVYHGDNIDDILVSDVKDEHREWSRHENEETILKDQVADGLFDDLLDDLTIAISDIEARKQRRH